MKLVGEVNWVGAPHGEIGGQVKQAVWRSENEIVLECASSDYQYCLPLTSKDAHHFEGNCMDKSRTSNVHVTAALYTNKEGAVLIGKWVEDYLEYRWWAELRFVKQFAHETTSK